MPARHWMPGATKRKMPFNGRLPKRQQSPTVILHTNGGGTDNGSLYGWFSRAGNDICSHFQVAKNGRIEQYVGIDRQAYAQYSGNAFAVSIETEDDGNPQRKWTKRQVAAIVDICHWLGVPAKVSPDGPGGGVGWHQQYGDWNRSGHNCPGSVRIKQIKDEVIPALHHAHQSRPKHKRRWFKGWWVNRWHRWRKRHG
jgi:hypothetical protein